MPHIEIHRLLFPYFREKNKYQITGHFGHPIIMFPTSQGSLTQNSDFHLNGSIDHFTDSGKVKLFNLETLDKENFYNDNISPQERIWRYENYVQFLIGNIFLYPENSSNTSCSYCRL
jgi:esterase/lipase superfamily enzyme